MKIVAVNTSPRVNWNTAVLVRKAAEGAEAAGAEIIYFDLYRAEKFTGCISCFGCKLPPHEGYCVIQDGLYPVLEAIREADAVIIGTPNYLGQPSAGFHALYERLVFQNITYQKEQRSYHKADKPVLFIMTSNMPEEGYAEGRYADMIRMTEQGLAGSIGPVKTLISGNTLQVDDYSRYNWTMFDPVAKKERHDTVFPKELQHAYEIGAGLVNKTEE